MKNPDCEKHGCGEWKAPMVSNPDHKGKWFAPKIDNPDYKGSWSPRQIANKDYFYDESPHAMAPIGGIGIELWTMQDGILFDNILIAADPAVADEIAQNTFVKRKALEQVTAAPARPRRHVARSAVAHGARCQCAPSCAVGTAHATCVRRAPRKAGRNATGHAPTQCRAHPSLSRALHLPSATAAPPVRLPRLRLGRRTPPRSVQTYKTASDRSAELEDDGTFLTKAKNSLLRVWYWVQDNMLIAVGSLFLGLIPLILYCCWPSKAAPGEDDAPADGGDDEDEDEAEEEKEEDDAPIKEIEPAPAGGAKSKGGAKKRTPKAAS